MTRPPAAPPSSALPHAPPEAPLPALPVPERLESLELAYDALGFDFDGTLVSMETRPEDVKLAPEVLAALVKAARRGRVVLCTGRALVDLARYIPADLPIDRIGNHGAETIIWRDGNPEKSALMPESWSPFYAGALPALQACVAKYGGEIEDKRSSLSIHYRMTGGPWWESAQGSQWLEALVADRATIIPGKLCWNVVPRGINKGVAIAEYASRIDARKMIFFGDEPTDEWVFRLETPEIMGVKVGHHPGPTAARFGLDGPQNVREWLLALVAD